MNANNLLKKISKAKIENKVKVRIIIDVVDLGDGKEDINVYGPFGGGDKPKIMCMNILSAAQMRIAQYQDQQSKIKLPTNQDVAKANKSKIIQ